MATDDVLHGDQHSEEMRAHLLDELQDLIRTYKSLITRLEAKLRVLADFDAADDTARVSRELESVADTAAALYERRFEIGRRRHAHEWALLGEALAALRAVRERGRAEAPPARREPQAPVSALPERPRRLRRPLA
ncbi:MAG: hypothetical protein HYU88_00765 [Chloroflexi bacterium]|nr:hypothetical protein [Chloroflexota bacterium]